MTIPTREEALKALDKISSDYDLAGGWSPDPMPLLATLRSYIESHTGEPVAWQYLLENGRWSNMPGDWTPDEDALGRYTYRPLFASPVQPVKLEWSEGGLNLLYHGRKIGSILDIGTPKIGAALLQRVISKHDTINEARSALESAARQWLSGVDK